MPMGKGRGSAPPKKKKPTRSSSGYYSSRQGAISAENKIANRARDEARWINAANGVLPNQDLPDPYELFLRTQEELAARALQPGATDGGGGSRGRGGGGGGGGGGGASAAAQQAALQMSLKAIADLYAQEQGNISGFAEGARARAGQENKVLAAAIAQQGKNTEGIIGQRTAAIAQIMADAERQRAMFDQIARRDLQAQGVSGSNYGQAAGLEQQRLAGLGTAQNLYGADLNSLARQQQGNFAAYGAQSQRDVLANIGATEQLMIGNLAKQRAQEEAQLRIQAAAAGVKL